MVRGRTWTTHGKTMPAILQPDHAIRHTSTLTSFGQKFQMALSGNRIILGGNRENRRQSCVMCVCTDHSAASSSDGLSPTSKRRAEVSIIRGQQADHRID